jgi:hypothetical protein
VLLVLVHGAVLLVLVHGAVLAHADCIRSAIAIHADCIRSAIAIHADLLAQIHLQVVDGHGLRENGGWDDSFEVPLRLLCGPLSGWDPSAESGCKCRKWIQVQKVDPSAESGSK